jgi:hypothetical protein
VRRLIFTTLAAISLVIGCAEAEEVIVRMAPPAAIVETRPPAPHGHYVWVGGYHRWDGHAYAWVPGRWDVPPHAHAVWVSPRWVHRNGGYVFVEGRWK